MAEPRRTFGPVVLLGLAAAGLSAVAGAKQWQTVDVEGLDSSAAYAFVFAQDSGVGQMPLAGALALVLLACWGVILVTRGRVRRVVTWLALLAATGLVATVGTGWVTLDDQFEDVMRQAGGGSALIVTWTPWFWVACLGAVLSLGAALAAVRLVGTWPEMGTKYDAPTDRLGDRQGDRQGRRVDAEADESQDLWKALDEGRDPTS